MVSGARKRVEIEMHSEINLKQSVFVYCKNTYTIEHLKKINSLRKFISNLKHTDLSQVF